jgi:RNA polymerase sigma-70 factor (ECF subfamily)
MSGHSGQPHLSSTVAQQGSLSDEEVVARTAAGETALFEILMRRYNQRLFRVARGIMHSDAEAEDVVQQSYLLAYTHLAQFGGAAAFSTWLTRIVINEALGRTRRSIRLAEVEMAEQHDMSSLEVQPATPEDLVSGREIRAILEAAISRLPEAYRIVVMMREVEQLSVAETAQCLEISEENVKVRLHRAKAMLRQSLNAQVEDATTGAFSFLGARCDRIVAVVLSRIATLPLPKP